MSSVEGEARVPGSERLAVLAWWGVLISPPVIPLLLWLRSPEGTLHRAHAKAAMTLWAAMWVIWVPSLIVAFVQGDDGDLASWGVALGLGLTIAGCAWGTTVALRGALPPDPLAPRRSGPSGASGPSGRMGE